MATLSENIAQAISDFSTIKIAIINKGGTVPDGTPTSQYGEKIAAIPTFEHYEDELVEFIEGTHTIIDFPPPVTKVGQSTFQAHPTLQRVILNENCKTLEGTAFYACNHLTQINLDNVENLGASCFSQCRLLTNIGDLSNVKKIESNAFQLCEQLTGVINLTNTELTYIGQSAFNTARRLTGLNLGDNITEIRIQAFETALTNARGKLTLPSKLETIGYGAFNKGGFDKLVIKDRVTLIDERAFNDWTNCTDIVLLSKNVNLGTNSFQNNTSLSNIYFAGTQAEFEALTGLAGSGLTASSPTIHYNYTGDGSEI